MQETLFKLKIQKWEKGLSMLEENIDDLNSQEQEAITTLKNLWRKAKYGPDIATRVERMVKQMVDSDKFHSNNRDIIQASKDFRGTTKEMFCSDEETFNQFIAYCKKTQGGSALTDSQRRRPVPTPQPAPQPAVRPQQPVRPQPTPQPAVRPQQPVRTQPTPTRTSSLGSGSWSGFLISLVLLLVIGGGGWFIWNTFMGESKEDVLTDNLKGNWNGEFQRRPATLIIDSVANDSIFGYMIVNWKYSLEKHRLKGTMAEHTNDYSLTLDDVDANKRANLNGSYAITVKKDAPTVMNGSYANYDTRKHVSFELRRGENAVIEEPATKPSTPDKNVPKTKKKKTDAEQEEVVVESPEKEAETTPDESGPGYRLEPVSIPEKTSSPGYRIEFPDKEE